MIYGEFHPRVLRVFPITTPKERKYLDVVINLMLVPNGPDAVLGAEIKRWADRYRDQFYPDRELRYNWEATA